MPTFLIVLVHFSRSLFDFPFADDDEKQNNADPASREKKKTKK